MILQKDLEKEITALRTQLEHHPLVAEFSMEVQRQKATIRSLREDSGILTKIKTDKDIIRQLDEEYKKLMTEQESKDGK